MRPSGWSFGVALSVLCGCGAPVDPLVGLSPQRPIPASPAFVGDAAVAWTDLQPLLAEASGGEVLREVALTLAVRNEARARGVTLSADALDGERALVFEALGAGGASGAGAERLADRVRRERGLGPERFALLVERSALLHAMVAGEVVVTDADLATAVSARGGERRVARVIAAPTREGIIELRNRVLAADDRRAVFIDLAIAHSTDPTAPRGGLTEPIGLDDPAYPPEVRRALAELAPGEVSGVLALERAFVVLMGEGEAPAADPPQREALEREVRLAKERLAMDRLAAALLAESGVRVVDPSLRWGWESGR